MGGLPDFLPLDAGSLPDITGAEPAWILRIAVFAALFLLHQVRGVKQKSGERFLFLPHVREVSF